MILQLKLIADLKLLSIVAYVDGWNQFLSFSLVTHL